MKKIAWILILLVLIGLIAGVCVFRANYVRINGAVIDRDATEVVVTGEALPDVEKLHRIEGMKMLDLRSMEVSPEFYDMLSGEFPNCLISWNVFYQAVYIDNSVTEISVRSMTPEYEEMLKYFPNLQTVDARECRDYDALLELITHRPDLQVTYDVDLGDVLLPQDAVACTVTDANVRTLLQALPYLPELQTVNL